MIQGLMHVYTGDGKGKTTAALGLLIRAYGHGMHTILVQFLKGSDTGEIQALAHLQETAVLRHTRDFGFFNSADKQEKEEMTRQNNENLIKAFRLASDRVCSFLILDEICAAYHHGAIDTILADKLILDKPCGLELVLTGRNAPQHFIDAADYVTEFVKHKHPYDKGIAARKGVEF